MTGASATGLPAADGQPLGLGDGGDADHRLAQAARHLGDDLRVLEEGGRLHDRLGAAGGVTGLEDAGADEHAVGAQLHHHGGVGGGGDAAGGEQHHRQAAGGGDLGDQLVGGAELLGGGEQLVGAQAGEPADVAGDGAHVADRLDDVAGARPALG